jgi:hypothetical protein
MVVIASEAKQSMEQQARELDCFASLAMTISGTVSRRHCEGVWSKATQS